MGKCSLRGRKISVNTIVRRCALLSAALLLCSIVIEPIAKFDTLQFFCITFFFLAICIACINIASHLDNIEYDAINEEREWAEQAIKEIFSETKLEVVLDMNLEFLKVLQEEDYECLWNLLNSIELGKEFKCYAEMINEELEVSVVQNDKVYLFSSFSMITFYVFFKIVE